MSSTSGRSFSSRTMTPSTRPRRRWTTTKSTIFIVGLACAIPDLNPIEHLWGTLKRNLASYDEMPKGVYELWEWVQVEWDKITKEDCLGLIESMPRRVASVVRAKGGYTQY